VFECNCNDNRRDKLALRSTSIKIVKFKIIKYKDRLSVHRMFYYRENLNWAACGPRASGWTQLV